MELKDFVKETLSQIVSGIHSAQLSVGSMGAIVNPKAITQREGILYLADGTSDLRTVQMVDFEVSLTHTQDDEARGGIAVLFGAIGIGAQGKTETGSSAVNRVKFSVPVRFPPHLAV